MRWRERIHGEASVDSARNEIIFTAMNGIKEQINELYYRVVNDNINLIVKQLSPLHKIVVTAYQREVAS